MRRAGILLVAISYGLSFVAVCLAACLMGPMVADHACCAGDDGIRASSPDCCSVTPAVAQAGAPTSATLPAAFLAPRSPVLVAPTLVPVVTPVEFSSSPPLVLRV